MPRTTGDADLDLSIKTSLKKQVYRSYIKLELYNESSAEWEEIEFDIGRGITFSESGQKLKYINFAATPTAGECSFSVPNKNGVYSEGSGDSKANLIKKDTKIRITQYYPEGKMEYLRDEGGDYIHDDNNVPIRYQNQHIFFQGVYYLDSPSFSDEGTSALSMIRCKGRDIYKRAFEADANLGNVSGQTLDQVIKTLADRAGIGYDSSSIADLSGFTARTLETGFERQVKVDKAFEQIMYILQSNEEGEDYRYEMYTEYDSTAEDNLLFVQRRPTLFEADFAFTENEYDRIGTIRKNYDKQIRRITFISNEVVPGPEVTLKSSAFTTAGQKTLSWTGNAEYKSFTVDTSGSSGDISITLDQVNPTSLVFTISGTTVNVTINIRGNRWGGKIGTNSFNGSGENDFDTRGTYTGGEDRLYTVTIAAEGTPDTFDWSSDKTSGASGVAITGGWQTLENGIEIKFNETDNHTASDAWTFPVSVNSPKYEGEGIDYENMVNQAGGNTRIVSPLLVSNDEGKDVTKTIIDDFGTPVDEMRNLIYPRLNAFVKRNDMVFPWVKNRFINNLYFIVGIKHQWDEDTESSSFDVQDSGLNFEDVYGGFNYDAGLYNVFIDIPYNIGVPYNGTYGPNATEAEIRAAANYGTSSHRNDIGYS